MKKVPIIEVEAGQVVARPVTTGSGMVMVQSGAVLTAEIIGRLTDLGVDVIWVDGVSADARPVSALLAELDERFVGHEDDALMMELKSVIAGCISQASGDGRD
jgi:hypothetical protein